MIDMKPSSLIYLDTAFIVEAYEAVTGTQPPVTITKAEDVSATLSAGFISGGASTTETKEFPVSSGRMYERVRDEFKEFPSVDLLSAEYDQLPDYFWMTGIFGAAGSQVMQVTEVIHRESYFRLYSDLREHKKSLILVVNDVYFSTGYDQIQKHLAGSCQGFGIAVKGLFKYLANDIMDAPICTPLVMMKEGNV
jgi:hypothetical protein